jgi:hypothetical protein
LTSDFGQKLYQREADRRRTLWIILIAQTQMSFQILLK